MILHTLLKKVDIEISARATPQAVLQPAKDRLRVVEVRHTWSSDDLALQSEGAVPISHQGSKRSCPATNRTCFQGTDCTTEGLIHAALS
jgi:hypothetical protein